MIQAGTWKVIRVDGTEVLHQGRPSISDIEKALSADYLDTVTLNRTHRQVMFVDDAGQANKLPNIEATKLYHAICKPGTTYQICGDVAIVNDADF